jgi:hypothetical protein
MKREYAESADQHYAESADRWSARVLDATNASVGGTATGTIPNQTCAHVALGVNAGNTTVGFSRDGGASTCISGAGTAVYAGGATFRVGNGGTYGSLWTGNADECAVFATELSDAQLSEVARAGIDGALAECDGTDAAQYKSCADDDDCRERANTEQLCGQTAGACSGRRIVPGGPTLTCTPSACSGAR